MDDHELLRRYAEENSEDAFRQLVERHSGMVYGVALRQLRHSHQAKEVTHAVFAALANKAAGLRKGTVLAGWLYRATRFASSKLQRDEERRQRREKEAAMMMNAQSASESDAAWEQIAPLLDAELESLGEKDRCALLMRFFEDRSFKEVGEALGASEDAAKMRVARTLERLHRRFLKRRVVFPAAVLAGAFVSNAAVAAAAPPSGLAASITKVCVAKSGSSVLIAAILRQLTWWKWKPLIVGACAIVATCLGGFLLLREKPTTTPPAAARNWPAPR